MSIRNSLLEKILEQEGGEIVPFASRNKNLNAIIERLGGTATENQPMNALLLRILSLYGGSGNTSTRNSILRSIVIASGGTITDNTRNGLLKDWLEAVEQSPVNLYWNPEMEGGSSFVAGVGTNPDSHVLGNNSNTIDAEYLGASSGPAYIFNADKVEGRLAFRQVRSTNEDLLVGSRYQFSAEVYIDGYTEGVDSINVLRGINVNNNTALTIDRTNADHSGANGTWEYVELTFDVIGVSGTIYLAYGQGVIEPSPCEQRTRNIILQEIPNPNTLTHNGEVLTHNGIPLTHTGD